METGIYSVLNKWKGEGEDEEGRGQESWRSVGLVPVALGPLGSAQPGWAVSEMATRWRPNPRNSEVCFLSR